MSNKPNKKEITTVIVIEMRTQVITTVRIPAYEYEQIKKLTENGKYLNFADFVRKAVKRMLEKEVSE